MKVLMILSVMYQGHVSTAIAEFDDYNACNAAGRSYMERTAGRLEIIWECVARSEENLPKTMQDK